MNPYWGNETNYYPGSNYVDIGGADYYPYGWNGNNYHIQWIAEYDTLRATGKPFALMELGQCSGDAASCVAKDSTYIITDIRDNMPNTIYWSNWNSFWGLDQQNNLSALVSDLWVINRDDNPSGAAAVPALNQNKKPSPPVGISIQ